MREGRRPGSPLAGRGPDLGPDARRRALFFFNDTATTEIYPLSLHDALPISPFQPHQKAAMHAYRTHTCAQLRRSEERFSRNAETDLVCRLLLEKKKTKPSLQTLSLTFTTPTHTHYIACIAST